MTNTTPRVPFLLPRWMGYYTQVFNVGNLRRMRKETSGDTADFFDPNNAQAKMTRERVCCVRGMG